jgi:uncharacterized protein
MPTSDSWPLFITILGMLVGLAGTFLPVVPGLPIIVVCAVLYYAFVAGWTSWSIAVVVIMVALTAGAMSTHLWLGSAGARRQGASTLTSVLTMLAGVIGLFIIPGIGAILLPIGVVLVIEWLKVRNLQHAGRAAFAYFVGWLMSTGISLIAGLIMIGIFWYEAAR